MIDGVPQKDDFATHNIQVINNLPDEGEYPWLTRRIFGFPPPWPHGTYRSPIIHFGLSLKDGSPDEKCPEQWLIKFEDLLRNLYWIGAEVHISTEYGPDTLYRYCASRAAMDRMFAEEAKTVQDWIADKQTVPNFDSPEW